jgi:hypothetical protein
MVYSRKTIEKAGSSLVAPGSFGKMEKKSSWQARGKANWAWAGNEPDGFVRWRFLR